MSDNSGFNKITTEYNEVDNKYSSYETNRKNTKKISEKKSLSTTRKFQNKKVIKNIIPPLRNWQTTAIDRTREFIKKALINRNSRKINKDNHLYIGACVGAGKTRYMYESILTFIASATGTYTHFVLINSKSIRNQMIENDFVGKYGCIVSEAAEDTEYSYSVLTIPGHDHKIVIGTWQCLNRHADDLRFGKTGLIIFDEVHIGGSSAQNQSFANIRNGLKPVMNLYVSATLQNISEKLLGEKKGHVFSYSMKEAYEDGGILNPIDLVEVHCGMTHKLLKIANTTIGNELVEKAIEANTLQEIAKEFKNHGVKLDGKMTKKNLSRIKNLKIHAMYSMINVFFKKHFDQISTATGKHEQAIFFCPPDTEMIDRATEYYNRMLRNYYMKYNKGKIPSERIGYAIHSNLDVNNSLRGEEIDFQKAEERIEKFRNGDCQVVFVGRMLREGYDHPTLRIAFDCNFFTKFDNARIAIVIQRLGRVARLFKNKEKSRYYYARNITDFYNNKILKPKIFNPTETFGKDDENKKKTQIVPKSGGKIKPEPIDPSTIDDDDDDWDIDLNGPSVTVSMINKVDGTGNNPDDQNDSNITIVEGNPEEIEVDSEYDDIDYEDGMKPEFPTVGKKERVVLVSAQFNYEHEGVTSNYQIVKSSDVERLFNVNHDGYEEHIHEIIRMIKIGMSYIKIGKEIGVTDTTISRWANKAIADGLISENDIPDAYRDNIYKIINMIKLGVQYTVIGKEIGINNSTISYWINKAIADGLISENDIPKSTLYSDKINEVIDFVKLNKTNREIAREIGVAHGTIALWLKKAINNGLISEDDIQRSYQYNYDENIDEVINEVNNGVSYTEIGSKIGVSNVTIGNWINKAIVDGLINECDIPKSNPYNDNIHRVIDMVKKDITYTEIGKEIGFDSSTISNWIKKAISDGLINNDDIPKSYQYNYDCNIGEVINMIKKGMSYKKIGKEIGVIDTTISRWINKAIVDGLINNGDIPRITDSYNDNIHRVIDMVKKDITYTEIGKEIGVSRNTIDNWIKKAKLNNLFFKNTEIQTSDYSVNNLIDILCDDQFPPWKKDDTNHPAYIVWKNHLKDTKKSSKEGFKELMELISGAKDGWNIL